MNWPTVTIQICTYNRPKEILEVINSLVRNLRYPASQLRWLVCDDASPALYHTTLAESKMFHNLNIKIISTAKNSGWGANVNQGIREIIDTDYTFFIEDDKILGRELNLKHGVALMQEKPHLGMLRYRGTAGTHVVFHQFEGNISEYVPDYREGNSGLPGRITYLQLDSGSPTLYIYSHGPHLKRKSFHEFYGLYPEGRKLGDTEESFAHHVKDMMHVEGAPGIAILPEFVLPWFEDIGKSYQGSEFDK